MPSRIQTISAACIVFVFILILVCFILPALRAGYVGAKTAFRRTMVPPARQLVLLKSESETLEKDLLRMGTTSFSDSTVISGYQYLRRVTQNCDADGAVITSGGVTVHPGYQEESFSLSYSSTFHSIGKLVGNLENGRYPCRISSMHLAAPSLVNSKLDISISLSLMMKR